MRNTVETITTTYKHKRAKATFILTTCALMTYVLVPAKAAAAVLPETAKLVPPETVLLVNINDFGQLKQQFEKTNLYNLYKDPAMAAFVDDAKAKLMRLSRYFSMAMYCPRAGQRLLYY